jgi:hypothetical protein
MAENLPKFGESKILLTKIKCFWIINFLKKKTLAQAEKNEK